MSQDAIENKLDSKNQLVELLDDHEKRHVGFVYAMTYDDVKVLTNDSWRERVGGIPQNSLLLATALNPQKFGHTAEVDRMVVLLRVQGPCTLPQDGEMISAMVQHHQTHRNISRRDERDGIDPITHGMLQFGGLTCRVLGTFYLDERAVLKLGADIEDYMSAAHLRVYKPSNKALERIVNYFDPDKRAKALDDAKTMGFKEMPDPFEIGAVRYTSSNRLQVLHASSTVPIYIQPMDFISRRTAVLGMTRTGKSNTVKTTIASVYLSAARSSQNIGQLVFDLNGEYANSSGQDDGSSIADVFADNTVRYRTLDAAGFFSLKLNFYESIESGLQILQSMLKLESNASSQQFKTFLALNLIEPEDKNSGDHNRWLVKKGIYQTILFRAKYAAPANFRVSFICSDDVLKKVCAKIAADTNSPFGDENEMLEYCGAVKQRSGIRLHMELERALQWFTAARDVRTTLTSGQGKNTKAWFDEEAVALLDLLVKKNSHMNDNTIVGYDAIGHQRKFHGASGSDNVGRDIYNHLLEGRIVILDLSDGNETVKKTMSESIARDIFSLSAQAFTENRTPPTIVMYIEEAHNLIGKGASLDETWPRIAKEGAKLRIALVYATQEPSSVHPNIMANTENMFVSHLNNDDEIKALSKYYDFIDFAASIKKAQDVGFARIKTLSSPFVLPAQIKKFDPEKLKESYAAAQKVRRGFTPAPRPGETARVLLR